MTNGSNQWDVGFSDIEWFRRLLSNHANVQNVERHHDIVFEIDRKAQKDHLSLLCCRQYTMSFTQIQRGLHEFGRLNIFYIGGNWCGYTQEAKNFCIQQKIGLYRTDEMTGALWKDDYWAYHHRDEKGHPCYYFREE